MTTLMGLKWTLALLCSWLFSITFAELGPNESVVMMDTFRDVNFLSNLSTEWQQEQQGRRNRSQLAANVTFLLNNLLKQYDNSLRPNLGGPAVEVEVNLKVRSMGPISEIDMSYSMDCYFRQTWVDDRLSFSSHMRTLALSVQMLNKIWKPDTYILNGKRSYLHTITTPNKFVRLFANGRVLYSQRLTIKAACQMDLADFPMDIQRCPLIIGSFGYGSSDVRYHWSSGQGVFIAEDMKLSQFDLVQTHTLNETIIRNHNTHSTLESRFLLERHMGNFVIQVYGPCSLLVVISWVSFWLNREATSDRISLGVTTVLTITFLGLEARTDLPQVTYPTALDFFIFVSFIFIFATIVQFALVHYFTKVGGGEYFLAELEETICALETKKRVLLEQRLDRQRQRLNRQISEEFNDCSSINSETFTNNGLSQIDVLNHHPCSKSSFGRRRWSQKLRRESLLASRLESLLNVEGCDCKRCLTRNINDPEKALNSVSRIDRISRIVFPLAFTTLNAVYWLSYLKHSQRIALHFEPS